MAAVGIGRVPAGRGLCCRRSPTYGYGKLRLSDAGGRKRRAFLAHIGEMCIFAPKKTTMNDIAAELAKLHVLKGADYSRQVERIARTVQAHWRVA